MIKWLFFILIFISCVNTSIDVDRLIPSPIDGINYYQLKQVDFDGLEELHPIFSVQRHSEKYSNSRIAGITYTSDGSGNWESDVWDGSQPTYSLGSNDVINITSNTDIWGTNLVVSNYFTLNVYGILELNNLTLGNNTDINIFDGGVLIIRENIDGANSLQVESGGVLVVGGNITGSGNSDITNTGGTTYICGSNNVDVNTNTEKNCTDLINEQPEIVDRISDPLPITLLYQKGIVLDDGSINIEFETLSEHNSNYVSINWSNDGENWIELDTLHSKNKPYKYNYLHK